MGRTTGLLISFAKCNQPAPERSWSAWYDDVHLPDLLQGENAPWLATRWELTQKPQSGMPGIRFSHVTLYDTHHESLQTAVELSAAALAKLAAAGRKHPCHTGASTVTLQPSGRYGSVGLRRRDLS